MAWIEGLGATLLANWAALAVVALVVLAMMGRIGKSAGAFHLFRDDDELLGRADRFLTEGSFARRAMPLPEGDRPRGLALLLASPAFWSGVGLAVTVGVAWLMAFGGPVATAPTLWLVPRPGPGGPAALVGVLALSVLASWQISRRHMAQARSDGRTWDRARRVGEHARAALGGVAGAVLVLGVLALAGAVLPPDAGPVRVWLTLAAPFAVGIVFIWNSPHALACVAIFSLAVAGVLALGLVQALADLGGAPRGAGVLVAIGLGGWLVWANGRRGKYRLPGFAALYDRLEAPQDGRVGAAGTLTAPVDALEAWKAQVTRSGDPDPVLVLVATSGGAYRATFWTSLLLDRLVAGSAAGADWPGLAGNIRVLTGASGGMVAAAYFAAMAEEEKLGEGITARLIDDTRESLRKGCRRRWPIGRDSLSPVVHQMVRRDLWHSFRHATPRDDRGRVLERQWTTLDRPFDSLRESEGKGIAPALIFSPMLVETGALALMSNLDLGDLRERTTRLIDVPEAVMQASVEVFRQFAGSQGSVTLGQAARMSASFPYVSPAVSLPTKVDRRVVDAGYYDNYGIDLASGLLQEPRVAAWIKANCAGVAVIEARAFPTDRPTRPPGNPARAFQFLTSPPEALVSARSASQVFRNNQQLRAAAARYDPGFLRVFTFEAVSDVSMSWYLRLDEVAALAGLLEPPDAAHHKALEAARTWLAGHSMDDFVTAVQCDEPVARRHQITLQRAVIAAELEALRAFWANPRAPDPRCAPGYAPSWRAAAAPLAGRSNPVA